jgi:hypothetical protein
MRSDRISVGTPANLTVDFLGFLQSFQTNSWIALRSGHDQFLPVPFQFIIHESSYHPTLYSVHTDKTMKSSIINFKLDPPLGEENAGWKM